MRRAARDLAFALLLAAVLPREGAAADFDRSYRDLDGAQFLEDEPIWVCDPAATAPGRARCYVGPQIRGVEEGGRAVESRPIACTNHADAPARSGELVRGVWFDPREDVHPLETGTWGGGGLSAGTYEVLAVGGRVRAAFLVVAPRGSEASVRAALARAARLSRVEGDASREQAARLYEAVLERYPNTAYVTTIWAGLWRLRAHSRAFAVKPGSWLEAVFARFHNTCFGVWALDRYMADVPAEESRPLLRRLVGLYPDTKLARAAAAYL